MPNTSCESSSMNRLYKLILDNFPETTVTQVQRKYFNEIKGFKYFNNDLIIIINSISKKIFEKD